MIDRVREALGVHKTLKPAAHWNGSESVMDLSAIERETLRAEIGERQWADLRERWRQAYAAPGAAHRVAVLSSASFPCSYCRTDPGSGPSCRTCGAPA